MLKFGDSLLGLVPLTVYTLASEVGLENRHRLIAYPGFESLPLRHLLLIYPLNQ